MNSQQKPRRPFATVLPTVSAVGRAVVTLLLWLFAPLHEEIVASMCKVSEQRDPIYQTLARQRLEPIVDDCKVLGSGRIEFESTETWCLVYELLLRSPGLHLYRTVAYVETPHFGKTALASRSRS